MGRTTFDPARAAPQWTWPDLKVHVLTSRPLSPDLPAEVIAAPTASRYSSRCVRAVPIATSRRRRPEDDPSVPADRRSGGREVVLLTILLGGGLPVSRHRELLRLGLQSRRISPTVRPSWRTRSADFVGQAMSVIKTKPLQTERVEGAECSATISLILDRSEPGQGPRLHPRTPTRRGASSMATWCSKPDTSAPARRSGRRGRPRGRACRTNSPTRAHGPRG